MIWCFADYIPELWDKPPCNHSRHERFFGLVRPDGSLKPHARVIKEFAATNPVIQPIPQYARMEVDPDEFYHNPSQHLLDLYNKYLAGIEE
ncbi:MAG: hypothetical protein MUO76_15345 [Anaerolineaceae bacterium]|nr:hypothetical protein [Anaerolineaceae bacterium]